MTNGTFFLVLAGSARDLLGFVSAQPEGSFIAVQKSSFPIRDVHAIAYVIQQPFIEYQIVWGLRDVQPRRSDMSFRSSFSIRNGVTSICIFEKGVRSSVSTGTLSSNCAFAQEPW